MTDLGHSIAILWRCERCGSEYTADGICGQNQPYECREELMPVTETEVLTDVVAALRLALIGCDGGERFRAVTEKILEQAPATPSDNTGGVSLLLRMQRAGDLEFHLA